MDSPPIANPPPNTTALNADKDGTSDLKSSVSLKTAKTPQLKNMLRAGSYKVGRSSKNKSNLITTQPPPQHDLVDNWALDMFPTSPQHSIRRKPDKNDKKNSSNNKAPVNTGAEKERRFRSVASKIFKTSQTLMSSSHSFSSHESNNARDNPDITVEIDNVPVSETTVVTDWAFSDGNIKTVECIQSQATKRRPLSKPQSLSASRSSSRNASREKINLPPGAPSKEDIVMRKESANKRDKTDKMNSNRHQSPFYKTKSNTSSQFHGHGPQAEQALSQNELALEMENIRREMTNIQSSITELTEKWFRLSRRVDTIQQALSL